jgi:hypothetical protein
VAAHQAFSGVGDQCHAANAAPLDGLSQELASEAPAAALRRHKEFSKMARYTVTPLANSWMKPATASSC